MTMLVADDESEFQGVIKPALDKRRVRIIRSNFGAHYQDQNFLPNADELALEYQRGEIDGALIYAVPLPSATPDEFVAFIKSLVGPTPPVWLLGIYQDWERWAGQSYAISGDHSSWANRAYGLLAHYMGSWTASGFYGNKGDLAELIPNRDPRGWVIEANYCSTLDFKAVKGQIAQQYTDGETKWGMPPGMPNTVNGVACDQNAFDPARFPTGARLRAYMRPTVPAHAAAAPTVPPFRLPTGGPAGSLVDPTGHARYVPTTHGFDVYVDNQRYLIPLQKG